jgi:S-adenosylmethionine hydrolase
VVPVPIPFPIPELSPKAQRALLAPPITLTTDFGEGSSYVAAVKGAILAVNPANCIVDLSHSIPPQNLAATNYFLGDALPYFPMGAIHVVVVDPGVGCDRALLCVVWNGQYILLPDNGCWTSLEPLAKTPVRVYRLCREQFWRKPVSATFHGRDILGPVAGHLSLGVSPDDFGVRVEDWVRFKLPEPIESRGRIRGEVIMVDGFGNLISNIRLPPNCRVQSVALKGAEDIRFQRTYGESEPGTLVALTGSCGRLEVAVVNGSAAARLGLGNGDWVELTIET